MIYELVCFREEWYLIVKDKNAIDDGCWDVHSGPYITKGLAEEVRDALNAFHKE